MFTPQQVCVHGYYIEIWRLRVSCLHLELNKKELGFGARILSACVMQDVMFTFFHTYRATRVLVGDPLFQKTWKRILEWIRKGIWLKEHIKILMKSTNKACTRVNCTGAKAMGPGVWPPYIGDQKSLHFKVNYVSNTQKSSYYYYLSSFFFFPFIFLFPSIGDLFRWSIFVGDLF